MPSYADLDSDSGRLPEGFTRTGYDADTETYHYTDQNGASWSGLPGNRYGRLYPSGSGEYHAALREDGTYGPENEYKKLKFWQRQDGRGLLTFLLIAFVYLLFVMKYTLSGDAGVRVECSTDEVKRIVKSGDTCWKVSQEFGVELKSLSGGYADGKARNERLTLNCDKLVAGDVICISRVDEGKNNS